LKEPRLRGPDEIEGWGETGGCSRRRARADETPPADEKPADTAAKITLPPGFKPMKRGKYTLYCRTESVMGTRLPTQKCYDEEASASWCCRCAKARKIDQMRRICGSMDAYGGEADS
jgi:hypothetical protein